MQTKNVERDWRAFTKSQARHSINGGMNTTFEWNEDKRNQNYDKHGVDLLEAALIFDGPTLTRVDNRRDYGEVRYISLGLVADQPYVVVHTERNGNIRLISAWKGGRKDYENYKNRFP